MGIELEKQSGRALLVCPRTEAKHLQAQLAELGFSAITTTDSAAEALEVLHTKTLDVVITEQNIKGRLNGLELAQVMATNAVPTVVLSGESNSGEIFDKPRLRSVFLLQKPVDSSMLQKAIQEIQSEHKQDIPKEEQPDDHFFIRVNTRLQRIHVAAIEWIESEGNYCVFHYKNKRFALKISLRKVMEELGQYPLVQIHKKYVVHRSKIETIDISEGKVYLENQVLPIGRRYRQDFLDRLHWIK